MIYQGSVGGIISNIVHGVIFPMITLTVKWSQTMEQIKILTLQKLTVTVAPTSGWGLSKKIWSHECFDTRLQCFHTTKWLDAIPKEIFLLRSVILHHNVLSTHPKAFRKTYSRSICQLEFHVWFFLFLSIVFKKGSYVLIFFRYIFLVARYIINCTNCMTA